MSAQLLKGNGAIAEAAIRAGCEAYFGYPITPQTELLEHMSKRTEESLLTRDMKLDCTGTTIAKDTGWMNQLPREIPVEANIRNNRVVGGVSLSDPALAKGQIWLEKIV